MEDNFLWKKWLTKHFKASISLITCDNSTRITIHDIDVITYHVKTIKKQRGLWKDVFLWTLETKAHKSYHHWVMEIISHQVQSARGHANALIDLCDSFDPWIAPNNLEYNLQSPLQNLIILVLPSCWSTTHSYLHCLVGRCYAAILQ